MAVTKILDDQYKLQKMLGSAVWGKNCKKIDRAIELGADVNSEVEIAFKLGKSTEIQQWLPLEFAVNRAMRSGGASKRTIRSYDIVIERLLQHGANPFATTNFYNAPSVLEYARKLMKYYHARHEETDKVVRIVRLFEVHGQKNYPEQYLVNWTEKELK